MLTEKAIVAAAQKGAAEFARQWPRFKASELLSDAYLAARAGAEKYNPAIGKPEPYLGQIIFRALLRYAKRNGNNIYAKGNGPLKLEARRVPLFAVLQGLDFDGDDEHARAARAAKLQQSVTISDMITHHPWIDALIEDRNWQIHCRAALEILAEQHPQLVADALDEKPSATRDAAYKELSRIGHALAAYQRARTTQEQSDE